MNLIRFLVALLLVSMKSCNNPLDSIISTVCVDKDTSDSGAGEGLLLSRGALLLTRFRSLDELKEVVDIEYPSDWSDSDTDELDRKEVRITHCSGGRVVTSVLKAGVSQADMSKARDGGFWEKIRFCLMSPYVLMKNNDLERVHLLSRRRPIQFGEGDVAFYDLAETMVYNKISEEDIALIPSEDLSEKGYINTFNHITAQALMTTLFSERLADFVADVHERYNMPELINGVFTKEQLEDIETGPVDNYVDMVNNEWGQELGKALKMKYNINHKTYWTPQLMSSYLNDILCYNSWSFGIGFKPFRVDEVVVTRFANKVNLVLGCTQNL